MFGEYRQLAPIGGGLEREDRIARGFGGIDAAAGRDQLEGEAAEPCKQIRDHPAALQRLARRRRQRRLAIARRLEEARLWKAHRDIAETDRRRHRLVLGLGAKALVDRQPRQPLRLGKGGEQLVLCERRRSDA